MMSGFSKENIPFEAVFESAPDAMVIVDDQKKIVLINSKTEQLFGYSRSELVGEAVQILVPKRHKEQKEEPNTSTNLSLEAVRKDGSEIPIEISFSPIEHEGRHWISVAIRDVSDKKKLLDANETRKKQIESIFENVVGAIYRCKATGTKEILFIGDQFEQITGYNNSRFKGSTKDAFLSLIHPDDLEKGQKTVEEALINKKKFIIQYQILNKESLLSETFFWPARQDSNL